MDNNPTKERHPNGKKYKLDSTYRQRYERSQEQHPNALLANMRKLLAVRKRPVGKMPDT